LEFFPNNGEILVITPSLIITRAEAGWVVDLMDQALTAAVEEDSPLRSAWTREATAIMRGDGRRRPSRSAG